MNSSIKLVLEDFGGGRGLEPVIKVKVIPSDDPRDVLVQSMFQDFGELLYIHHDSYSTDSGKSVSLRQAVVNGVPIEDRLVPHQTSSSVDKILAIQEQTCLALLDFIREENYSQGGITVGQWLKARPDGKGTPISNEALYEKFVRSKELNASTSS